MNKILRSLSKSILIVILLPLSMNAAEPHFNYADNQTKKELRQILQKSKTAGEFLSQIKSSVDESAFTFLKSKIKGQEKTPIKITENNNGHYTIEVAKALVVFNVESQNGEKLILTVNNKKIEYKSNQDIVSFWNTVTSALPQHTTGLWSQIVPEAHAIEPVTVMAVIATVSIGSSMYFINKNNCMRLSLHLNSCTGNTDPEQLIEAADFLKSLVGKTVLCSSKKPLQECLKGKAQTAGLTVPDNLREIFGLPAINKSPRNISPLKSQ